MSFVTYTPTPTRLVTLTEADGSEPLEAATTNISLEQMADGILWLDQNTPKNTGGIMVIDYLVRVLSPGEIRCEDGLIHVESDGELRLDVGSLAQLKGKTRTQPLQSLSDADHSLNVTSHNNRLIMRTAPAANRIVTLLTTPLPQEGDWFELTVLLGTSAFTVGLQRQGSSDYVAVIGDGVGTSPFGSSNLAGTARVQYDGGLWRLSSVGGVAFYGGDA